MPKLAVIVCAALSALTAHAELPASRVFSAEDQRKFNADMAEIEQLRATGADKPAMDFLTARNLAAWKQWPEAIQWLQRVADGAAGFDPAPDPLFKEIRDTPEFKAIVRQMEAATPPVIRSQRAFDVGEGDLAPESLAYDPRGKHFYFGSLRKGTVVRCTGKGACTPFASGLDVVIGLKIQDGNLWLLSNPGRRAALVRFDLASGKQTARYEPDGEHLFNDLALTRAGDVYITDSRAGAVWHLAPGAAALTRLPGTFRRTNGITVSADERLLYVTALEDGIRIVDRSTHASTPLGRPAGLSLGGIDGLYFHRGSLISIQNYVMTPVVKRFRLSTDGRSITRADVLERRHPLYDEVTTGVIVGNALFYMANIQENKKADFRPITILRLPL
ncbi:MAG: SMP-30/gluconolactonase/LRE family protein [Bryobacterales bacterium]|nr:SMP-30/gluconolactonase/LRE family protein [Bryobacterales bacterium]